MEGGAGNWGAFGGVVFLSSSTLYVKICSRPETLPAIITCCRMTK